MKKSTQEELALSKNKHRPWHKKIQIGIACPDPVGYIYQDYCTDCDHEMTIEDIEFEKKYLKVNNLCKMLNKDSEEDLIHSAQQYQSLELDEPHDEHFYERAEKNKTKETLLF